MDGCERARRARRGHTGWSGQLVRGRRPRKSGWRKQITQLSVLIQKRLKGKAGLLAFRQQLWRGRGCMCRVYNASETDPNKQTTSTDPRILVSLSLLVRHNTLPLLLPLGLLGPMRLAKRRSDHQREHERGVGIYLSRRDQPSSVHSNAQMSMSSASDPSRPTLTLSAPARIFPHETASSGRAPESEPSYSWPVLMYTAKSAPFLCKGTRESAKLPLLREQKDHVAHTALTKSIAFAI